MEDLKSCLKQVNVVVAGPGLNEKADEHLHLIWKSKLPLVLDAYGLRWLAQNNPPKRTTKWIAHLIMVRLLSFGKIQNREQ